LVFQFGNEAKPMIKKMVVSSMNSSFLLASDVYILCPTLNNSEALNI